MDRRTAIQSVVMGTVAPAALAPEARAAGKATASFSDHWESAKAFTLKVADAMPADSYDFKPKPDMRDFAHLMQHLASVNVYYISRLQRMEVPDSLKPPTKFDKETIMQYLAASFDYCAQVVKGLTDDALDKSYPGRPNTPPLNGWELVLNGFIHTAHHRGYADVYLREKNVVPPNYAV
jgi:uncharacterized damage-inducible protein DinB